MHLATFKRFLEVVKVLVSHGAQVNARTAYGKTPIMIAYEKNASSVVSYFLPLEKTDVFAKDIHDRSVWEYACQHDCDQDRIKQLRERIVDEYKERTRVVAKKSVAIKADDGGHQKS